MCKIAALTGHLLVTPHLSSLLSLSLPLFSIVVAETGSPYMAQNGFEPMAILLSQ